VIVLFARVSAGFLLPFALLFLHWRFSGSVLR